MRLFLLALASLALVALAHAPDAFAQARNPFSVGISEGGGSASGITGWILAQQHYFDLLMRNAVRAIRSDSSAAFGLIGVAFAYGVFHAAGPGHGKAVLAAYLVANERALKRGLVMAGLAALLQAIVAIAIVGGLSLLLGATAHVLRNAARYVEIGSYVAIALVGAALVWRKGRAFLGDWRKPQVTPVSASVASRFQCTAADDPSHVHGPDCGHFHMPDPATLNAAAFNWRDAAGTVIAAGLRPCSGAILVLVFSAAQGIFWAGLSATFAMALGTALTTGALAVLAVYGKGLAQRMTKGGSRGLLAMRGLELAAALGVLLLGLGLLSGTLAGGA